MHVITVLRMYFGNSQMAQAREVGITQADISEMETMPPYGYPDKYIRLSKAWGVPVDCLLKDDFTAIPESFFEQSPLWECCQERLTPESGLGREGEEYIFARERERVGTLYPTLAKLILPLYKMRKIGFKPGYDILSFDDRARPICLEVKTSALMQFDFNLTPNEMKMAQKLTKEGEDYRVVLVRGWGSDDMWVKDIPFCQLMQEYKVEANRYCCSPIPEKDKRPMSGIAFFRRLRGFRQADLAEELNIAPSHFSLYETGDRRPTVDIYLKLSDLLDASVEQLMGRYEPSQLPEGTR